VPLSALGGIARVCHPRAPIALDRTNLQWLRSDLVQQLKAQGKLEEALKRVTQRLAIVDRLVAHASS
jgi:hypothetical protein